MTATTGMTEGKQDGRPNARESAPEFLAGGGAMGALMRSMDWGQTRLGPTEAWPQSLRTSVSTCLNCSFPILIWWGPDLVKIYNDAYAAIIADKHPRALGAPGREVWPEIWDTIGPMLSRVMTAGEASPADDLMLMLHRRGFPEECYFSFSYSPIRDETGRVGGVFCPVIETTERVFGERRSAVLLELEGRLRDASDPLSVKTTVCELLGKSLGVAQVGYSELDATGEHVLVEGNWSDGRVPSVSGLHRLDDYGPLAVDALRHSLNVVIEDVARDPRTSSPAIRARYAALPVRSFLEVPLIKAGRLVAILFATEPEARIWRQFDIALMRDVAERTWSAVERTRGEAALRESEIRWRTFFQNMREGFALCEMVYDGDGLPQDFRYLEVNAAFERLTGIPPEAILGRLASEAISDIERFWTDTYAHVVETGEPAHFEYQLASIGRWFEVLAYRTEPGRFAALFLNVTDRKLSEAALRHSEQEFRALGENLPNLCWMANADGWIYWYNARWYEYTGTTPADVEGWGWQSVHDPETLPSVMQRWTGSIATGMPFEMTFPLRGADGVFRPFLTRVVPVPGADGAISRWFGTNVDISEQQQTEAALRTSREALRSLNDQLELRVAEEIAAREQVQTRLIQAQRMEALGQLAGGIAHDFNNVLQAVSGGLSLIQRRAADVEVVRQLARMAADAATRGAAITGRLLAFARKGELQAVPVEPQLLLESLREMLAHTLGAAISVRTEVDPQAVPLLADKAQLETVLVNLAVNARDAMPDGGILTVSAHSETVTSARRHPGGLDPGNYVRLTLADTGNGMDTSTLARAGEPFFTTKPIGQGTGLGLAMARGFAQQSGGSLAISSVPGRGTVVTLWFPKAGEAGSLAGQASENGLIERGAVTTHVLVVDDDAMVREVLAGHLEDRGYRVSRASDGLDALAWLDAGASPDLLVTDFAMPGMNGLALIAEARKRLPGLPVLLLTGYADASVRLGIEDTPSGIAAMLLKPVSGDALATRAAALLEARAEAAD